MRSCNTVQTFNLIPTLNAWAARAPQTIARPIALQFPGHSCIDDLITELSFDSQAMLVIAVLGLFLTCYPWMLYNQALTDVRLTGAGI